MTPDASFCNIEVGGAIAVPGQLCAELTMPAGVECRDAWSFFEPKDEPTEPVHNIENRTLQSADLSAGLQL